MGSHNVCMCCGRRSRDRPRDWGGEWHLQRAHLGSGSGSMLREEDVRAVVALCPLCHMCHSVDGKQVRVNGEKLPGISNANMIWIKKNRDAELYDEEYLKKVWCGAVPEPVQPSMYFMLEFGVR